jgi:hypothetical protein
MPTSRADRAFILAPGSECSLVKRRNRRAAGRNKAYRTAIRERRGLPVSRFQNEEFWSRFSPDRAVIAQIVQTLVSERAQYAVIERACLREVVGPDGDVREYCHSILHYNVGSVHFLTPMTSGPLWRIGSGPNRIARAASLWALGSQAEWTVRPLRISKVPALMRLVNLGFRDQKPGTAL